MAILEKRTSNNQPLTKRSNVPLTSVVDDSSATTDTPRISTKTSPTTKTLNFTPTSKFSFQNPTTNSTSDKIMNAITGALLGVGTKIIFDKVTGEPKVVPKTAGVKPATSVVTKPLTDAETLAELDRVKKLEEDVIPEGAVNLGDGTYSVTANGMITIYDSKGNILSAEDENLATSNKPDLFTNKPLIFDDYAPGESRVYDFNNGEKRGGLISMMKNAGAVETKNPPPNDSEILYNNNGGGTFSYYATNGDYVTVNGEDGTELFRTDENGKIIPKTTGDGNTTFELPDDKNKFEALKKYFQDSLGLSDETLASITGVLPAAGAGALVASLLNAGSGGSPYKGVDMSKVGAINPRTTDFGIGPTNFVGYKDYGTSDNKYTPNEELLRNLNAPGYNPVNEGDYDYEGSPTEIQANRMEIPARPERTTGTPFEISKPQPKMASGGLSSMSTPVSSYYTFGQPADIMANLGMRPQPPMNSPDMMTQVAQSQQSLMAQQPPQGMPQGLPQNNMMPQGGQQGMPQQGMPPPMRNGGLPHISNVPLTQGRMDFRQGSAVHGEGDGQSDDIPAMLADGEYVLDAELVAQIGNGSTKAGAQALDKFRENIRAHKRSAPINKIPPKTKVLTSYLKGAR